MSMYFRIPALAAVVLLVACGDHVARIVEPPPAVVVTPACTSPAPLLGKADLRIPDSYIVAFHSGTDALATTTALEQKYGFASRHVYSVAIQGFAATLSPEVVAGIRCEPAVDLVEYDGVVSIAS